MLQSMTGYGKSVCELPNKTITIEIKSLNSKQFDIYTKIPSAYKEIEIELRNSLSKKLIRGKIELSIWIDYHESEKNTKINESIVADYYKQLKAVAENVNIPTQDHIFEIAMRMPDVLKIERPEFDPKEWETVQKHLGEATLQLQKFREQEGLATEKDIENQINRIADLLKEVIPFEEKRIIRVKERIQNFLQTYMHGNEMDDNRFEQELIYYIEKLDISEEKLRLSNHLSYFLETMKLDEPVGKKLTFISQEIGREINTLGSKANDSDIQKIVVMMKDCLERIKEQLLNIL